MSDVKVNKEDYFFPTKEEIDAFKKGEREESSKERQPMGCRMVGTLLLLAGGIIALLTAVIWALQPYEEPPQPYEEPPPPVTMVRYQTSLSDEQLLENLQLIDLSVTFGQTGNGNSVTVKLADGRLVTMDVGRSVTVYINEKEISVKTYKNTPLQGLYDIVICSSKPQTEYQENTPVVDYVLPEAFLSDTEAHPEIHGLVRDYIYAEALQNSTDQTSKQNFERIFAEWANSHGFTSLHVVWSDETEYSQLCE